MRSATCSEPWSSTRATPGPAFTWAWPYTIAGSHRAAVAQLNAAVRLQPDDVAMLWQTAWILATSPDPTVRDGARAVELATSAIQLSKGQEPHAWDTLAAALAETGEFSAAVETAEQASTLALLRNDDALAGAIAQRTRLYRRGLAVSPAGVACPAGHAPPAAAE